MKKFADFSEENKTFSEPAIRIDDILEAYNCLGLLHWEKPF